MWGGILDSFDIYDIIRIDGFLKPNNDEIEDIDNIKTNDSKIFNILLPAYGFTIPGFFVHNLGEVKFKSDSTDSPVGPVSIQMVSTAPEIGDLVTMLSVSPDDSIDQAGEKFSRGLRRLYADLLSDNVKTVCSPNFDFRQILDPSPLDNPVSDIYFPN